VYAGVVTGSWSGVVCLLIYGLGRILGVPFEMVPPGGSIPWSVPWFVVLVVPIVAGVAGGLLAALALGRPHARQLVFWLGTAVALLSVWPVLAQPSQVLWSSRIWLAVMHGVTWLLVVPQIARIVGDSEPGAYVDRPTLS
jgi:hypothetical protein